LPMTSRIGRLGMTSPFKAMLKKQKKEVRSDTE